MPNSLPYHMEVGIHMLRTCAYIGWLISINLEIQDPVREAPVKTLVFLSLIFTFRNKPRPGNSCLIAILNANTQLRQTSYNNPVWLYVNIRPEGLS
jgi:hypothetical protein